MDERLSSSLPLVASAVAELLEEGRGIWLVAGKLAGWLAGVPFKGMQAGRQTDRHGERLSCGNRQTVIRQFPSGDYIELSSCNQNHFSSTASSPSSPSRGGWQTTNAMNVTFNTIYIPAQRPMVREI